MIQLCWLYNSIQTNLKMFLQPKSHSLWNCISVNPNNSNNLHLVSLYSSTSTPNTLQVFPPASLTNRSASCDSAVHLVLLPVLRFQICLLCSVWIEKQISIQTSCYSYRKSSHLLLIVQAPHKIKTTLLSSLTGRLCWWFMISLSPQLFVVSMGIKQ